jgi:large subunit ribosomal protein L24
MKIKKGDLVQVISGGSKDRGGDKGKQGRVLAVNKEKHGVIVEGVNIVTKHQKVSQTDKGAKTGGLVQAEAPIHVSNVALIDPKSKKPTRVGFKEAEGKKVRIARKSGEEI